MISSIIYLLKKIETSFSARYLVERNGSGKQTRDLIDNLTKMSEKKKKDAARESLLPVSSV